jgi:hypothetical protein
LRALESHRTNVGRAPAADIAAVRKHAAKAIKQVRQLQRLRKTFLRNGRVKRLRLRARDLPRARRRDKYIKSLIGKPVSKVFGSRSLRNAEKQLISVLKQQPMLP